MSIFKLVTGLILFFFVVAMVMAQDKVKLSVGYVNTEFRFNPAKAVENLKGFSIDADGRIVNRGNFRLGGVFNYQRTFAETEIDEPMRYTIRKDVNRISLGPQISYRVGPIEPFAAALFGYKSPYLEEDGTAEVRKFTRAYRLGVDVPFHKESNFFIRPFFVEWELTEGLAQDARVKYGVGAGFRF